MWVDVSRHDLDNRVNPRDKCAKHVEKISSSIKQDKQDAKYPIIMQVPASLIGPTLLPQLSQTKPFQQFTAVPPFCLNNVSELERILADEIFWERSTKPPLRFFSETEVSEKRNQLDALRPNQEPAKIVNRAHRINAMVDLARLSLEPLRQNCVDLSKKYFENPSPTLYEELQKSVGKIQEKLISGKFSSQVLVFKDTANPVLMN